MASVFDLNRNDSSKEPCFFGAPVNLARYDKQRYPFFDKLTEKQNGFFWKPEEVLLTRDSRDFRILTNHEQHIFTSNLKRQILLDSVQGRAPAMIFNPICSLPELENWIVTWTYFESIHSRAYTHVIRNVYSDPSIVFDKILDIQEIVNCAKDISLYYDNLLDLNIAKESENRFYDEYEHKRALWLCLNAVNALEGVRFYVSFACSWAFAETKRMEGNAKIIKFIARDENLHLAATQNLLKILPKEDEQFRKIEIECQEEVINMFKSVIEQEKEWVKYLFKDGSIVGLNDELLSNYVDWIGRKRMITIGLPPLSPNFGNPLSWTQKWIAGEDVQVSPQEVALSSYIIGGVKQDIDDETFKGITL